jgi:hypothetical protein
VAELKAKRPRTFKQQKFPTYQALYHLNLAFQIIAQEIERLNEHKAVPPETLRLYRATAEELRSAMNHRLTEILRDREMKDCAHYGEEVRSLQEQLES